MGKTSKHDLNLDTFRWFKKKYRNGRYGHLFSAALTEPWHYGLYMCLRRGRSDAGQYEVILVQPRDIVSAVGKGTEVTRQGRHLERFVRPDYLKYSGYGSVLAGDWDQARTHIASITEYLLILERFGQGRAWDETISVRRIAAMINDGRKILSCSTQEEFRDRLAYLDALVARIRNEGYKRSTEHENHEGSGVSPARVRSLDEIIVNIGRSGEFLYVSSGRHRLAIAQVLDITEIPVLVKIRHAGWQAVRDAYREAENRNDLSSELLRFWDHPDLVTIRPGGNGEQKKHLSGMV
jgi:hypothetical protein